MGWLGSSWDLLSLLFSSPSLFAWNCRRLRRHDARNVKGMSNLAPYIHRKVVVLQSDSTVEQAAKAMNESGVGSVFISDHQGHINGVLTDRDIACRLVAPGRASSTPVSSIMTPNPFSVTENADLSAVMSIMETHGIRRVPVVHTRSNGTQRCEGVVSLDDLLASRDMDDYHVMRIVRGQIKRRILGSSEFQSWLKLKEPGQAPRSERSNEGLYRVISLATDLTREKSMELVERISAALVRRLHHTAAAHLIVTLPMELQRNLNEIPPGPDSTARVHDLRLGIVQDFGFSQAEAESCLVRACRALEEWIGFSQFAHVKAQLPDEMRVLFSLPGLSERQVPAEGRSLRDEGKERAS